MSDPVEKFDENLGALVERMKWLNGLKSGDVVYTPHIGNWVCFATVLEVKITFGVENRQFVKLGLDKIADEDELAKKLVPRFNYFHGMVRNNRLFRLGGDIPIVKRVGPDNGEFFHDTSVHINSAYPTRREAGEALLDGVKDSHDRFTKLIKEMERDEWFETDVYSGESISFDEYEQQHEEAMLKRHEGDF